MTLKSTPPPANIHGDAEKYLSYREAWARIQASLDQGFYLEAVTIEESIIRDRLTSHLTQLNYSLKPNIEFARLIQAWRRWAKASQHSPIACGAYTDLVQSVDDWRKTRNLVVHGIVKPDPQAAQYIVHFVQQAETAAREGKDLARAVCDWYRKVWR